MNQIAIGDGSAGYTVIEGEGIVNNIQSSTVYFSFDPDPYLTEKIEIILKGSSAQISSVISALETILIRAEDYQRAAYRSPQYLRFQPEPGGQYFYTPISEAYLESNPAGYIQQSKGSKLVILHYTRPNWFDGAQVEIPLSGRGGSRITGGYTLFNHTDYHATHGNTALVDPLDVLSQLPAPIRFELTNTYAAPNTKDLYFGSFHHPTADNEAVFFGQAPDLTGGTLNFDVSAIGDYYRRLTWSATTWTHILSHNLDLTQTNILDGRSFTPILLLFNFAAYNDLYFQIRLHRGVDLLYAGDPIYHDPDRRYIIFPPIRIPPHQLLRETTPNFVEIRYFVRKTAGGTYTVDVDQSLLFPQDNSAYFEGFFPFRQNNIMVEDNHRSLHNVLASHVGSETVSHIRHGGPFLIRPNDKTRFFFLWVNTDLTVDMMRTATVKAYYRHRRRLL